MSTIQTATAQGRRDYQEDTFAVHTHPDGDLLAVFDGHGGENSSAYLQDHFVGRFATIYNDLHGPLVYGPNSIWRKMMRTVFNQTFKSLAEEMKEMRDGSTASAVWISRSNGYSPSEVAIAVCGDSPVVVGQKRGFYVSPEHNARTNMKERKWAEAQGVSYWGGYLSRSMSEPGIQMTRALGDAGHGWMSHKPEIIFKPVLDFVLVASDGILDPGHGGGSSFADTVAAIRNGITAQDLVDVAVNIPTQDNVTAVLWRS